MFEKAVVLNAKQHGDLRYAAQPGNYGFAADAQFVPVVGSEAVKLAESLPIVFPPEGGGSMPMAMVGVRPGQNAFVDEQGQWQGGQVPVYLQRYPFTLVELPASTNRSEANRSYALCVVADAPHFSQGDGLGVPLFDEEGQPGLMVKGLQTELAKVQAEAERTQFMVRQLEEAGLLLSVPLPVVTAPGEAVAVKGARILHIDKFRRLDAEQKKALEPSGALVLAQVHMHSLKNLAGGRLGAAAVGLAAQATELAKAPLSARELLGRARLVKQEALPEGAFSNFLKAAAGEEPKA